MQRPIIAVIGPGDADAEAFRDAFAVGRLLAEQGCSLATGGLGGVMQAACEGFRSAAGAGSTEQRGVTIGILPGGDPYSSNPFVDVAIPTGMGEARNCILVNTAAALIAVRGGYGTLSEIALALRQRKRIVSLGSWDVDPAIVAASSPEEAVRLALADLTR